MYESLSLVVWRPNPGSTYCDGYEFILFSNDEPVFRQSGYSSYAAARRAGQKKADTLLSDSLFS